MKKIFTNSIKLFAIIFVVGFLFFSLNTDKAEAFACSTNTTGTVNWNAAGTWTSCNGGYPGQSGNTDTVTIANAAVAVTGNASVTVASITFTGGASASSINISGGVTLTVTGAVTISAPTASVTKAINVQTGAMSVGGLVTLASGTSSTRISSITVGTGTLTMSAGLTCTGSGEIFTVASGGIFNFTGTMSSGCLTVTINAASTTNFSGTVALNGAYTFGIVEVDSGTTTMGGVAITFAGTTLVRSGATLTASSATGTKTFTGSVTVESTGIFDLKTGSNFATATSFGGSQISHSGTTFNSGTGAVTLTGTGALEFAGSSNMNFGGTMTIPTNRALTNNMSSGTLTLGALTISSPTAANSFTLNTGTVTTVTGALTFSANVTANNQTITLRGTADLNVGGNLVMTGVPTSTGVSQIVCDGTGTSAHVDVTGTTAITAATTAVAGKNIVDLSLCSAPVFSSGGLITITGNTTSLATSFPELKVGSSGVITAGAGITTATNTNARLSTGSGSIINLTGALTITGQASLTNINANTELKTTGTASIASAITWAGSLNVVSGTTTLGGVAITISGATTISGTLANASSGTLKTFTGLVTIASGGIVNLTTATVPTLSFAAGVTANSGAGSINFGTGTTTLTATQAFTASSNMTFGAVVLNSGVTLTNSVSTTLTLASLTLNSGAGGVTLPTGSTTTVSGAIAMNANATATNTAITMNGTANLNAGSATITAPTSTGQSNITCAASASGTFAVTGALTINGNSTTTGDATVDMLTCTMTVGGLLTINGGTNATGDAEVKSSTGTITASAGVTFGGTVANAKFTTSGAGTINLTGSWAGGGIFSINSGTTFNTSGTAALSATMTGSGALPNLNVLSGTTTLGNVAITVNGATNVTGTLTTNSATGTKTFTGALTVISGGVFDLYTGTAYASVATFGAGIVNNSSATNSFRTGSGLTTITGNLSGSGTGGISFLGAVTIASGTTTNNYTAGSVGTIVTGLLTLTGSWTQASNSTLYYNSTSAIAGAGTLDATATGNTVNYNNAAGQTVKVTTYRNLTLSGGGVKTAATTPTVNGVLSMEGTATITVTTGVVTYGSSATLQYNTTTARSSSSEEWVSPFSANGGVIIASTGAITLDSAKVMDTSVPLTINSGATLNTSGSNFQVTFGGNFVNSGGTFTANASPIVIASTMSNQQIAGYTTTGLTSLTKTSGTATFQSAVNGAGLTINGSGGTLNLGSSLTHNFTGDVTLTAGTLNGGSSSTLNLSNTSTTVWNGTGTVFNGGTGTVNFSGGDQTLAASTTTFNNLTFSGNGTKTFSSATTINGNFDNQSGGGTTYATWNPSDKHASVTLSNGDLTASSVGGIAGAVRATIGKSSGKWYWEQNLTTLDTKSCGAGVANATAPLNNYIGVDANGWSYWFSLNPAEWLHSDTFSGAYGAQPSDGDVLGVELDMDAGTLNFRVNNSAFYGAISGLSGTVYPAFGSNNCNYTITANFGATAFANSVPGGYNSGIYNAGGASTIATGNQTITLKGNFTNTGTALNAGSSNIVLAGTGTQAIDGFTTTGTVSMTKTSGVATLQGDLNAGSLLVDGVGGALNLGIGRNHIFTSTVTLTNGTLNAGGSNITVPAFSSSNANSRMVVLGSGTWDLTGTGTVWDMSTSTNSTVNPGSSTIKLSNTTATGKTFAGGGGVYKNVWFAGGSGGGNYTITGDNAFYDIKDNGDDADAAHSILIASGSTQHVSTWNVTGAPGNLITINSTGGPTHTLIKDINGAVNADYLNIQRSIAQPQGGIWFAGTHSVNNQMATGGSGWFFNLQAVYKGGGSGSGGGGDSGAGTCNDGIQNGNETGVDTGGRCAALAGNCQDGIQNGNETGVDTGGRCGGGGGNNGGGEGGNGAGTCNDGIQNGNETGVDTGGRCAALAGNCQDGIQNGNETGVDTGGRCGSGGGGGDSGFLFPGRKMFASVGNLDLSFLKSYLYRIFR